MAGRPHKSRRVQESPRPEWRERSRNHRPRVAAGDVQWRAWNHALSPSGIVKGPLLIVMLIPLKRGPDKRGTEPLSRQVYRWIRDAIVERALRAGEALPSTRELADENSISRTVVVQAYDQLMAEGFITGRRGYGTYVSEVLHPAAS